MDFKCNVSILDYLTSSSHHLSSTLAQNFHFPGLRPLYFINLNIPFLPTTSLLSFVSNFLQSFTISLPSICCWLPSSPFNKKRQHYIFKVSNQDTPSPQTQHVEVNMSSLLILISLLTISQTRNWMLYFDFFLYFIPKIH